MKTNPNDLLCSCSVQDTPCKTCPFVCDRSETPENPETVCVMTLGEFWYLYAKIVSSIY